MGIDAPNWQWPWGEDAKERDRGTGALGVKIITPGVPETVVATEDFETDPITGAGTWTLTTSSPHTGTRCLRSAVIGNNQSTDYTFPVPLTATHLRVWHRVSSELNFDFFQVYRDSAIPANLVFQLSGTLNTWQMLEFPLLGATQVIFRYMKDSSSTSGLDAAFIDDLTWYIPGVTAVQVWEPYKLTADGEYVKVITTPETPPAPLDCATDSVTICPGDDPIPVVLDEPIDVNVLNIPHVVVDNLSEPLDVVVTNIPHVIVDNLSEPITVDGTVALDAATLAALETINVGNVPHVIVDSIPEIEIKNDAGNPIPVISSGTGTFNNGVQTAVAAAAIQVAAANANRKKLIIQNTGLGNVRVGTTGVAATTGVLLVPTGSLIFDGSFCPTNAIFAIRDGLVSSTVLVQEIV